MKFRTFLLALLLTLSLTACGGGGKQTNDENNGVTSGETGSDSSGNNTSDSAMGGSSDMDSDNGGKGTAGSDNNNRTSGSSDANGGTVAGDIDGKGDSLLDPSSGANSQDGGNAVPQSHGGWKPASFDQMVRNGKVHDKDGILTDFENSVTPGSSHF
ncbi:MAG: hypothetical protein HFF83_03950 [Oscillibacter sp.]|jgi:hypothetical protein|nr:hypothetical protein [Oscillibacter sp.]